MKKEVIIDEIVRTVNGKSHWAHKSDSDNCLQVSIDENEHDADIAHKISVSIV